MSAMPDQVVFHLPKKPRIKEKDAPPDQRSLSVIPIRAGTDERLHGATLRALIVLCSYCNRAGITWVSQARLAQDLKLSRQAITRQIVKLRDTGYVEIIRKGFRGERSNTLRVIFDPTMSAEDAMAITSPQEDTRPPAIKKEQVMQAEQPDPEGQRRVAQAISKVLKQPTTKVYNMPKTGETRTVKEMKEAIKKHQSKGTHKQPPEVANESNQQAVDNSSHRQHHRQHDRQHPEVARNGENTSNSQTSSKDYLTSLNSVLGNVGVDELIAEGMTAKQIADNLDTLLPLYQAEGITPSSTVLIAGIRQLQADVR